MDFKITLNDEQWEKMKKDHHLEFMDDTPDYIELKFSDDPKTYRVFSDDKDDFETGNYDDALNEFIDRIYSSEQDKTNTIGIVSGWKEDDGVHTKVERVVLLPTLEKYLEIRKKVEL